MGRVAQPPLAAVSLLTPAPRSAATTAHRHDSKPITCVTDIDERLARRRSVAAALFAQCGERDLPDEFGP